MNPGQNPPLRITALVFAVLSVPLAFAYHLVSLALVLAMLAITFAALGLLMAKGRPGRYAASGIRQATWALWVGIVGALCSLVMWGLWASNTLLRP
jgi:hypothetical protein